MYGMSAGGHTALSLAGGRWSPARYKAHCQAHIAEDFQTCVGLDPRIAAIVAAVPLAADFDMASLAAPRAPLGLVTAGKDAWLVPGFHSDRVLQACASCERVALFPFR